MKIVQKGWELRKTIKNVGRLREIVAVLAHHGFDELLWQSGLQEKLPQFIWPKPKEQPIFPPDQEGQSDVRWTLIGRNLRKSFEELGPTFVKFGQLLSSRDDLFPNVFIDEMKVLLDQVKAPSFHEIALVLEREWKRPWTEVLQSINQNPIGKASIAVVYEGVLHTGESVVIKVQRPFIKKTIEVDLSVLHFLAKTVENVSEELKYLGLTRVIQDFDKTIHDELDFYIELLNADKLRKNLYLVDKDQIFHIPLFYNQWSTDKILVMEKLEGIPFTNVEEVNKVKELVERRFLEGTKVFVKTLLHDGFYHADLHGGNFFLLKNEQIGIIDFGLIGTLGVKERRHLVAILYCLVSNNFENLIYEFLDVAEYDNIPDVDRLVYEMRGCLMPYIGLSFQRIQVAKMFSQITKTLVKHQVFLPREWIILLRALAAMEGVGRSLNWDFDLFGLLQEDVEEQVKELFSTNRLLEEWPWGMRDLLMLARLLPRHLRWFLRDFSKKNYSFEISVKGLKKDLELLSGSLIFVAYSLFSGMLFLTGAMLVPKDPSLPYPHFTLFLWFVSILLFVFGIIKAR